MNQKDIQLLCDAGQPLCGGGTLREELLLYNVPPASLGALSAEFAALTGKDLVPDSDVNILSGGQKVLLMCLCALFSPARRILFTNLWHSLDADNRARTKELIARLRGDREISYVEDGHAAP
ncbi:MAG: hypothetical protein LHW45_04960 [Candidatus Cloacimonetes bacterium]|nr:hypothetical protein [Candidatus Cloacimonadota bacterium]MDY0366961.1 hypothetical protein [Candidatus Syntrophosphaera sp.]